MKVVKKFVEQLGHTMVISKSDKEPAILALKVAVERETSVEIVVDENSVGDYPGKGAAEIQ